MQNRPLNRNNNVKYYSNYRGLRTSKLCKTPLFVQVLLAQSYEARPFTKPLLAQSYERRLFTKALLAQSYEAHLFSKALLARADTTLHRADSTLHRADSTLHRAVSFHWRRLDTPSRRLDTPSRRLDPFSHLDTLSSATAPHSLLPRAQKPLPCARVAATAAP